VASTLGSGVNEAGVVVGDAVIGAEVHAFEWNGEVMQDLGIPGLDGCAMPSIDEHLSAGRRLYGRLSDTGHTDCSAARMHADAGWW
jgi:probable HAF family extracellular repeat protein